MQFNKAPPTLPRDTARVFKGNLKINLPKFLNRFGGQKKEESGGKKRKATKSPTPADKLVATAGIHDDGTSYQGVVVDAPSP